MMVWEVELLVPATLLVTVLAIPLVSPVLGDCLLTALVVVNALVFLPCLQQLLWPQANTPIMTTVSDVLLEVLTPLSRTMDFYAHVSRGRPRLDEGQSYSQSWIGGTAPEDARGDRLVSWVRHAAFVLSVVLQAPHAPLTTWGLRLALWTLGVRSLLSLLAAALLPPDGEAHNPGSRRGLLLSLPLYAGQLSVGVLCLTHCAQLTATWNVLGLLLFTACSDRRVQSGVKHQARRLQVDAADGFEGEVVQGVLILMELGTCVAFFVGALLRDDYAMVILSYANGFVSLMDLRTRVWHEVQAELRRMSGVRRATRADLRAHNDVCAVCLGAMSSARVTRCRHVFHGRCLREALTFSPRCPICKKLVARNSVYLMDPRAEMEGW